MPERHTVASGRAALAPFAALSASYFAHIGFFNPYLPLWLKDLGFSLVTISLLTAMQSATRLFAPYAWGALSDQTGERVRLLRYSTAMAAMAAMGLWFDWGVLGLALVLLVMFTHTSGIMPLSEAAMAHLVSQDGGFDVRRYGRIRLWGSAGFLFTVFAAGAWFDAFGMRHFPGWTLFTLGAIMLSAWYLPNRKEAATTPALYHPVGPVLRQPVVRWLFAAIFFHVLSHISIYVFFSLYLDALGYAKTIIGLMWAVSVVIEIGWFFTQGRWLPRLSLSVWLVVCAVATVVRMGITATMAHLLPWLILAQALHALTFAAHHTVCIALLFEHFPGQLRGRGQALYTVVGYGFPGVLGALLGGVISTRFGLAGVFWAATGMGLLAAVCAVRVGRLEQRAGVSAA